MTTWKEATQHRLERQARERRLYVGDRLGKPCPDCRQKVPAALNDAGIYFHPCCGRDARQLLEEHRT